MSTRLSTIVIASLSLGGLMLAGCKREAGAPPAQPPPAVIAASAIRQDVPVYLDEIGKIISIDSVAIVPQVGGKLLKAHVEDGAEVKKGQLLFEIDARPFEADVASAEASVAETRANVAWTTTEFNRIKGLAETNAVSQNEFDRAKNAMDVAVAKHKAAEAALDTTKLHLEYTKIHSPIDGRAGARLVVPGNIVKANDVPLMVIQRLDPIYAEFTITENELGTVRKYIAGRGVDLGLSPEKGLKVEVDVPGNNREVIAALGPIDGKPVSTRPTTRRTIGPRIGELTFLDNSVQNNTGTVKLRAVLPNSDRYFWPGQLVNCRLVLATKKDAVLIPAQAQQIGQQGPFVYVVTAQNTAQLRPITVGQRQGDMLVVESGLEVGERLIVTGQMMVRPDAPVQVIGDPAPSAPTTKPAGAVAAKH